MHFRLTRNMFLRASYWSEIKKKNSKKISETKIITQKKLLQKRKQRNPLLTVENTWQEGGSCHLAMIARRHSWLYLSVLENNNRKQVVVLSTLQVDTPRGVPNQDCIISPALQLRTPPLCVPSQCRYPATLADLIVHLIVTTSYLYGICNRCKLLLLLYFIYKMSCFW